MKSLALALLLLASGMGHAWAQLAPYALSPTALRLDQGVKTATAIAGAATLNKNSGAITTEALVTAIGATYVLTLTNNQVALTDQVYASVAYGTASTGMPTVALVKPAAGSLQVTIQNISASAALNGTLKIYYQILKQ